jgi:hypothetical protein
MSTDPHIRRHAEPHPADAVGNDLPLFRFGLRQLLFFVAVVSLLLALVVSSHGVTAMALLVLVMVVTVHLFGTALGTQLRSHANRTLTHYGRGTAADVLAQKAAIRSLPVTIPRTLSRSPWYDRGSTPLPWVPKLVVATAILGGAVGAVLIAATIGYRTSLTGILVGSASVAVVSGWAAFLGGSFYGIFRHGFREAVAQHNKDSADGVR